MDNNNIEIVGVYIVKKEKNMLFRDLIKNLDEDGNFEFNFENMIIVGLDIYGNTYFLDEDENALFECRMEIDFENIVAEGLDVDCALETLDRLIIRNLEWTDRPEDDMTEEESSDVWCFDMGVCTSISA